VQVAFQLPNGGLFSVPAAALVFTRDGPTVAVVGPDSTVHFKKITIARDDGDQVQLGSGVNAGDLLALNISNQIVDGQKVLPSIKAASPPVKSAQAAR
jgi:hypothetical protein